MLNVNLPPPAETPLGSEMPERRHIGINGGPGAIRTPDPQIRSLSVGIDSVEKKLQPTVGESVSVQGVKKPLQTEIGQLPALKMVLDEADQHIIRDLILLALDATDPDTLTAENLAEARHALIEALDIVEGAA
ncbi:MAG: hypothetical protein Q4G14_10415 [Paracoccus sp. (in: a-proteobacteria)]|uniref:hypothetical protein n=1 Tax=Paracoccus sp. TaxID=267 RepID=UPI0026E07E37|nr:hypothetical protein [Paracoccus sp. (in: a-proteobacteria)]MDO5613637.1 hypothetical protein [Paracoccus sp. (in: a-proteobacteria)]